MQVRLLVPRCDTKYGPIKRGQIFSCEPYYFAELNKHIRQVEELPDAAPAPRVLPGKDSATDLATPLSLPVRSRVASPTDGPVKRSSASPRVRRSTRRT